MGVNLHPFFIYKRFVQQTSFTILVYNDRAAVFTEK